MFYQKQTYIKSSKNGEKDISGWGNKKKKNLKGCGKRSMQTRKDSKVDFKANGL